MNLKELRSTLKMFLEIRALLPFVIVPAAVSVQEVEHDNALL